MCNQPTCLTLITDLETPIDWLSASHAESKNAPRVISATPQNLTLGSYFDVSVETYDTFNILINCCLLNLVSLLGIVGHLLSILVLRLHNTRESTTMVLLSLSVVDIVFLITTSVRRSHCLISRFDSVLSQYFIAFDRVYLATVNRIAIGVSTTHVVLISLERVVAVHFPFTVSSMFSTNLTRLYIACCYLLWLVLKAPYFDQYRMTWSFDPNLNKTVVTAVLSPFRSGNKEALNLLNTITSNIRGPVNICIVLASTILISTKLYQASIRRKGIAVVKPNAGLDLKVVKMLLVVLIVYLSVGIPVFTPYLFFFYLFPQAFFDAEGSPTKLYLLVDSAIDLMYVVNCSLNFVVYVKISSKFSATFKRVLGYGRPDRKCPRGGRCSFLKEGACSRGRNVCRSFLRYLRQSGIQPVLRRREPGFMVLDRNEIAARGSC